MSTILNTNGTTLDIPQIPADCEGRFYIFTADWNRDITHALRDGAIDVLLKAGVKEQKIVSVPVPGTVELVNGAAVAINRDDAAAIIMIGCVIRGDTPHFDYVCQIAAQGCAILNSKGKAPVIFGVLTVDNLTQARERAGGALGNKGSEAAVAALSLLKLKDL